MASIGLAEAAKLTGRNQSTIHRAMKGGRLSYTTGLSGERQIDTAELERVFGIKPNGAMPDTTETSMRRHVTHGVEIALLRQQLDDRDASIRDLRGRLDASEEERRGLTVRLLTDQRPNGAQNFAPASNEAANPNGAAAPGAQNYAAASNEAGPPRSAWRRFLAWRR